MERKGLRLSQRDDTFAAAAAKGAALMLREQEILDEVEIILPASETARFRLHGQKIVNGTASCYVIKESGDNHGGKSDAKVHVSIKVDFFTPRRIVLQGGACAGQAGSPGVAETAGEEMVNAAPKPLILEVVREVFALRCIPTTLTVTVGIPEEGLEIAV